MKVLYLSALTAQQELVRDFVSKVKPYGLEVRGSFLGGDLEKMEWMAVLEHLASAETTLWGILGDKSDFEKPELRYGLSLLSLAASARRSTPLCILMITTGREPVAADGLPTPLQNAEVISAADSGLGARLVAKAHRPAAPSFAEYSIDILGSEQIGQWFGIRPLTGEWEGAMFGTAGGEIVFQAVGPESSLPEKSVLNYPVQGLKLMLGDIEYTAWAVQNVITPETAYYAKVSGHPHSIVFGPYSTESAAEVYVIHLK
jgi:hypothetical protein